jgi:hypothetical protein
VVLSEGEHRDNSFFIIVYDVYLKFFGVISQEIQRKEGNDYIAYYLYY